MNLSINQTPSFGMIMKPQKMLRDSHLVTNGVGNYLECSKEYAEAAKKCFDLYFLQPTRKHEIMRVIFFDNNNETFVRDNNGRILEVSAKMVSKTKSVNCAKLSERVLNTLYNVIHGKYKAPRFYKDPIKYTEEYGRICRKNDITPLESMQTK